MTWGVAELLAALSGPVPAPLVALILKVYGVPIVKPETEIGDEPPLPVIQPGVETAVYAVIAVLPMSAEAVKDTLTVAPAAVAVPIVGALGLRGQIPCLA